MIKAIILVVVIGLLMGLAIYALWDGRECLQGRTERYTVPAHTQYIMVGKIMVPTFYPAYEAERFVCDEYEKEGWQ